MIQVNDSRLTQIPMTGGYGNQKGPSINVPRLKPA